MAKNKVFIIYLMTLITSGFLNAQTIQWGKSAVDLMNANVQDIENDKFGNVYVVGNFPRTLYLDNDSLISVTPSPGQDYTDIFLVKYDSTGTISWKRQIGGLRWDYAYDLCLDTSGNILLSGWCEDVATFSSSGTTVSFGPGYFICKYTSTGTLVSVGPNYGRGAEWLATDAHNNLFVGGLIVTQQPPHAPDLVHWYLLKKNAAGTVMWSRGPGDTITDWAFCGMCADPFGNCVVTGYNSGYFGSYQLPPGFLIAKYDSAGTVVWAQSLNFLNPQWISGLGSDMVGNLYIAGKYVNAPLPQSPILFVAKFDGNGNLMWFKHTAGGYVEPTSMKVDKFGNSYITGDFVGHITLDSSSDSLITDPNKKDVCVYKVASNGNIVWGRQLGGNGNLWGYLVSPDNKSSYYLAGKFDSTFVFGTDTLTSYPGKCCYFGDICVMRSNDSSASLQTGVQTVEDNPFTMDIFPNPGDDQISVHFYSKQRRTITIIIYDQLGQAISISHPEQFSGEFQTVLPFTQKGVFMVECMSNSKRIRKKVVLK